MIAITIDPSGDYLTVRTSKSTNRFHAIWLRDNANDPETRAPANGQRLIALRDIPTDTHIESVELEENSIKVCFSPEMKVVYYNIDWLEMNAYDTGLSLHRGWTAPSIKLWDSTLMGELPTSDFEKILGGGIALRNWLEYVKCYGFGRIVNGPIEEGTLFKICLLYTSPSPRDS